MNRRSQILRDAKRALRHCFERSGAKAQVDQRGYLQKWEDNLLPGADPLPIERDFEDKRGSELDNKFMALHSSAALVVNSFEFFARTGESLPVPPFGHLQFDGFEMVFPTGLRSRFPPHLDATAHNAHHLVAIESKCLEYFTPKVAVFADAYFDEITDDRRGGSWFAEMQRLRDDPRSYLCLDAAQLIKHAFGLALVDRPRVTLLYLFWEPIDASSYPLFAEHREEVATFASRVSGGSPAFDWMSYPELWNVWQTSGSPTLKAHAAVLISRYCAALLGDQTCR